MSVARTTRAQVTRYSSLVLFLFGLYVLSTGELHADTWDPLPTAVTDPVASSRAATDPVQPPVPRMVGEYAEENAAASDARLLRPVEVSARRLPPQAREDRSSAATVITRERLEEPSIQLQEVLEEVPGLRTTDSGGFGGFSTAFIRGGTAQQTDVYLDGIPLNRAAAGIANLSAIPVGNVERVEVYRGVAPLAFATSSIGGVINVVTREPRGPEAQASLGTGSFGTRTFSLSGGHAAEKVWALAGVSMRKSDGDFTYFNDRGTAFDTSDDIISVRENNHSEQWDALLKVGFDPTDDLSITLTEILYLFEGGLPGSGIRQATHADRDDLRSITDLTVEQYNWPRQDWHLRARTFYTHLQQRRRDPLAQFGLRRSDTDARTHAPGIHLYGSGPLTDWLTWGNFAAYEQERYRVSDTFSIDPVPLQARRDRWSVGTQPAIRLGGLPVTLVPNVSYEHVESQQSGRTEFGRVVADPPPGIDEHVNYRLGLIYEVADWLTLKSNVARAYRTPTFMELFGNSGYVLANPDLRAERGLNMDVGATGIFTPGEGNFLLVELFGFRNEVEDLIQFIRGSNDTVVATNFDGAVLRGAELGVQADLGRLFALRGAYTLLQTEQQSRMPSRDGKLLPMRPETTLYLRPELYHRFSDLFSRLSAYLELDYQSGNYVDPANFIAVPARWQMGAGAQSRLLEGRYELALRARNLTDNRVNDLIGFPLPGRSLFFEVRARL